MFNKDEIIKINEELSGLKRELRALKEFDFHDTERMSNLISMYDSVQYTNAELSREISELKEQLNQLHAKNNDDDLINRRIEALGINDLFVIITRKNVLGKYRYVKLPHFAFSDYPKSEFYQLKSATDATVFKNEHEANYFNPDPELFEVVPRNY